MSATKEYILEVSFFLFLQKSFKAVTIKEIVEQANVSKGAFYYYFESKKQLFEEVAQYFYLDIFAQDYEEYAQESLQAFYKDVIKKAQHSFLSIKKIKDKEMRFDINNYQLIFEAVKLLPKFSKAMKEHSEKELAYWKKMVSLAQKNGEIKSILSPEVIARTFIYLGDGFGMMTLMRNESKDRAQSFDFMHTLYDSYYNLLKRSS